VVAEDLQQQPAVRARQDAQRAAQFHRSGDRAGSADEDVGASVPVDVADAGADRAEELGQPGAVALVQHAAVETREDPHLPASCFCGTSSVRRADGEVAGSSRRSRHRRRSLPGRSARRASAPYSVRSTLPSAPE
jgi:hypothetical protein